MPERSDAVKRALRKTKDRSQQMEMKAQMEIIGLLEKLSAEDLKLSLPLLDAAVSGVILGFNPDDPEMRGLAEKSWKQVRRLLSRHLLSEDKSILPWAETHSEFPREKIEKFRKRNQELRALSQAIEAISFQKDDDASVAKAGKALCQLAVKLDDMIDGEERELFPVLRRYVTASLEKAQTPESRPGR